MHAVHVGAVCSRAMATWSQGPSAKISPLNQPGCGLCAAGKGPQQPANRALLSALSVLHRADCRREPAG